MTRHTLLSAALIAGSMAMTSFVASAQDPAAVGSGGDPALVGGGVDLLGFEVRRPSLEQVFVELTGEGFDVAR